MHYDIARLNADDTPSHVRFGFTYSENSAAHVAIATTNQMGIDTCVVEVTRDGERIVQRIRRLDGPPLERRQAERRRITERRQKERRRNLPPVESHNEATQAQEKGIGGTGATRSVEVLSSPE